MNTTGKCAAVFIPALVPLQLGALCRGTAMPGMQLILDGFWEGFNEFRTALPILWELAPLRELKLRAGSIQEGLSQVVCALNPAGYQDSPAFLGGNCEPRKSRCEDH